jgi:putative ubiquitin-RnfH superfamily antitoxin RatB of RatAB toxin-antitoxin module
MAPEMGMEIEVTVVFSPAPRQVLELALHLPVDTTLLQALHASGLAQSFPELDLAHAPVGIWGRKAARDQILRMHDRIEIYRPLRVDPKVARRERFAKQGARTAGLFSKRRSGAKPGY